jgi:hypothetical protein
VVHFRPDSDTFRISHSRGAQLEPLFGGDCTGYYEPRDVVEHLEMQLGELVDRFRSAHPSLEVRRWSFPVAQLTVDGWSLGFTVLGLSDPIEFELCVLRAHSKPIVQFAEAGWVIGSGLLDESRWRIFDLSWTGALDEIEEEWDPDSEGEVTSHRFARGHRLVAAETILSQTGRRLLKALTKAVRTGPVDQSGAMVGTDLVVDEEPEVVPLTAAEKSVLQAWFSHLRAQGFAPLQASEASLSGAFHLASPAQGRRVAARLDSRIPAPEALVEALLGALWPPEGLPQTEGQGDFGRRRRREFYRRNPRASGWMRIYRPGIAQDRAVLLLENYVGLSDQAPSEMTVASRLGCGAHLVTLQRQGQGWKVLSLHRLPQFWISFAYLETALQIHFDGRLQVLARDGGRLHLLYRGQEIQMLDDRHFEVERRPFSCSQPTVVVNMLNPEAAILALTKILEARGVF